MLQPARRVAAVAVLALTALAGCGDDGDGTTATSLDGPGGGGEASSQLEFTAIDIAFEETQVEASAGELQVTLVNEGAIEHSWVVEDYEDDLRLYTRQSGQTDEGSITLEAGDYDYYCDIEGHRAAGMEGALAVT